MNEERPDYINCIATHHDKSKSYCGRHISSEFHFTDIQHARLAQQQGSRLVACPDCVKRIESFMEVECEE